MIGAISNADENVLDAIIVNVETLNVTIEGALQDTDGKPLLFKWDMANDDTWTEIADLGVKSIEAVTLNKDTNKLYVEDGQAYNMYEVDPEDGTVLNTAAGLGAPLYDIAYSEAFSTEDAPLMYFVNGGLFLVSDPMKPQASGWDWSEYLSYFTGATSFIGIANMGETYSEDLGRDIEEYALLDNSGALWLVGVYDGGHRAEPISFWRKAGTGINEKFGGYSEYGYGASMVKGDNGKLYISIFSLEDDRNNIYEVEILGDTLETRFVGCTEEGVWPLMLSSVTVNKTASASNTASVSADFEASSLRVDLDAFETLTVEAEDLVAGEDTFTVESVKVEAEAEAEAVEVEAEAEEAQTFDASELMKAERPTLVDAAQDVAAAPEEGNGDTAAVVENNKLTLTIVPKDENGENVDSTNGLFRVTYDSSKLTLVSTDVNAEYESVNDKTTGNVVIGYVNAAEALAAGDKAVEMVFTVKAGAKLDSSSLIIDHAEVIDSNYDEFNDEGNVEEEGKTIEEKPLSDPEPTKPNIPTPANPTPSNPTPADTEAPETTTTEKEPDVSVPDETTDEGTAAPDGTDGNPPTGVAIAFVPAVLAAAGVIAAKKRDRK